MNAVTVNGKTYNLPNGNVSVIGNIVYCNGKIVTDCDEFDAKEITIIVQGDNNTVSSDGADITVNGNANNVSTKSGDVKISGNANEVSTVSGDIEVMGSIHGNCKTVSGDIKPRIKLLGLKNYFLKYLEKNDRVNRKIQFFRR